MIAPICLSRCYWREHPEHATEMVAPLDRLQPPSSLVMETPDDMRQRAQALIQRIGEAIKEAQVEGSLSAELGSVKASVHVVVSRVTRILSACFDLLHPLWVWRRGGSTGAINNSLSSVEHICLHVALPASQG